MKDNRDSGNARIRSGKVTEALAPTSNLVYLDPVTTEESPQAPKKSILDYFHLFLNRKLFLAAFVLVGLAVAVLLTLRETPLYRATTTLEIRSLKTGSALISAPDGDQSFTETSADLETQIRILESDSLAQRVSEQIRRDYPNRIYQSQDVFAGWRRKLKLLPKGTLLRSVKVPHVDTTVAVLGGSKIVEITCESWDPELARDYGNTLTREYLDYSLENLGASVTRISSWLSNQVQDARSRLERAQNQLQNYALEANLVYTGGADQETAEHKRLIQLQDDLAKATADRMVRQSAYEVVKSSASIEAVPAVANSDRLATLQSKLEELQRNYAELSATYTDSYPRVASIIAQIKEIQTTLARERQTIADRIRNEYEQSQNVESMLTAAYAAQLPKASDTARKGIQYELLKWEVETSRRIYEELLQRVKAISIGSTLQANSSVVLDPARLPDGPFRPAVGRNIFTGGMSGLMLGVLVVLGMEFINRRLKAPGEAEFHLGVPELGVIPSRRSIIAYEANGKLPKFLSMAAGERNGADSHSNNLGLTTWEDGPSVMAEAYRNALASILLTSFSAGRPRVILVTSFGRGEGKSSTVSNLGVALAESNQRVVLIDADLRKPSLHGIFEVANTWGLTDLLREKTSLKDSPLVALARSTSVEGLSLVPSGPGTTSIANLFYSERLSELVERLRSDFDTILIDTPPISYLSDARLIGRVVDGAILVVRAGATTRDEALAAKRKLEDDGIPLLGTILNGWDGTSKSRYGYPHEYPYYPATN
jgi:succinoglycan biosynthesis transport protein ExoP